MSLSWYGHDIRQALYIVTILVQVSNFLCQMGKYHIHIPLMFPTVLDRAVYYHPICLRC